MINENELFNELSVWNSLLRRKINLIACGGTAMTLLNLKPSTKDIDLIIPNEEDHSYIVRILIEAGYKKEIITRGIRLKSVTEFEYDLFRGNNVYTAGLLESPLDEGNNLTIREWSYIYLGCLNYYDLMITKLFRGTATDFGDMSVLWQKIYKNMDFVKLKKRYEEHARYDVSEEKVH